MAVFVYRSASGTDDSFTPRPGPAPAKDDTVGSKRGLSTFDRPDRFSDQDRVQEIDLERLSGPLRGLRDVDGHVSIVPVNSSGAVDDAALKEWASFRKSGRQHPFTKIVRDAVTSDDIRRKK